jgi:hypothetical protein
MCQAAWGAARTKNTYLSAFYHRMRFRKGGSKAVMALAHHMMLVIHRIVSSGSEYVELGGDFYDRQNKPKAVARLVSRLQRLGYQVDLTQVDSGVEPELVSEHDIAEHALAFPERGPKGHAVTASDGGGSATTVKRKPGRPCKCIERGIICKHKPGGAAKTLHTHQLGATQG